VLSRSTSFEEAAVFAAKISFSRINSSHIKPIQIYVILKMGWLEVCSTQLLVRTSLKRADNSAYLNPHKLLPAWGLAFQEFESLWVAGMTRLVSLMRRQVYQRVTSGVSY
jgi:hypothetical protein